MFDINHIILLASVLTLLGILSSKLSARIGLPVLVLFLVVGMLAGETGLGGIAFDSPDMAYALGTLALAMILFDGGLQTPMSSVRMVWKPASLLATVGVLATAAVTGLFAAWILDLPLLEGLLVGAIVGSTDAAAVFSQLRNAGVHIKERLKATLEIESASNDPMAIFLTVGLLEVLLHDVEPGLGLLQLFVIQMGIGAVAGLLGGWISVKLINRINLNAPGLYPVTVATCGLLTFGLAASLGGSGFLAIFIAGVLIGNKRFLFQKSTFLFHDGLAWLSQITMFVMLGLLVDLQALLEVWFEGLIIAAVLILLARPLASVPILALFGFNRREMTLVSWVGLRGSVPIILAIFPLVYGLPNAALIFNVVFFVVFISATVQGSTLAMVARALKLTEKAPATSAATLEITSIAEVDAEIVEYTLGEESRAVDRRIARIALPEGAVVAMITRGSEVIAPRGSTRLRGDDHLFVVLKPELTPFVDNVFAAPAGEGGSELPATGELRLKGGTRVGDIRHSYGISLGVDDGLSLQGLMRQQTGGEVELGFTVDLEETRFQVTEMVGSFVATVTLTRIDPKADTAA